MPKYNEKQITAGLEKLVEYNGFRAMKRITDQFQISNPQHWDSIGAFLKSEFNIDSAKGSATPMLTEPDQRTDNVIRLDEHETYINYNRRRAPRLGPLNFNPLPGESLRDVKD